MEDVAGHVHIHHERSINTRTKKSIVSALHVLGPLSLPIVTIPPAQRKRLDFQIDLGSPAIGKVGCSEPKDSTRHLYRNGVTRLAHTGAAGGKGR
jgi:hypothetical protein